MGTLNDQRLSAYETRLEIFGRNLSQNQGQFDLRSVSERMVPVAERLASAPERERELERELERGDLQPFFFVYVPVVLCRVVAGADRNQVHLRRSM